MQLNLPDAQQKLAVNGQKEELIESGCTNDASGVVSGDVVVTKE